MVIRVKKDGTIRITKDMEGYIYAAQSGRQRCKNNFREHRRNGARYYRWFCLSNERAIEEHIIMDGLAFDSRMPPLGGNPNCWCCFFFWIYDEDEIEEAKQEIANRVNGQE
ncbi:hypothetical protein [Yersinia massiliensis]|uniref:hypothetical protein n=1 Tax=Yersinia massiliensis TaxID=419257 RepID=UPI001CFE60B0|nr:hypothetical protein [Yersinia massiliensis]MCB5308336.1 hypothetical protein [Yersinia massiliensis]